ncbi:MAG: XRE family transcriptional regulator [Eubacteriales bacterium]|nr:XRE family transcriptional regulator [Eubacteriales bacterium]
MADINDVIGERLREIRLERNMTLNELSHVTHVSRSMLSAIERKIKTPTIALLTKIHTGLNISLSELLTASIDENLVAIREGIKTIQISPGINIHVLLEYLSENKFEIFRLEIEPGRKHASESQMSENIWEYLIPVSGELTLSVQGNETIQVKQGELAHFCTIKPHTYANKSDKLLSLIMIIVYKV